MEFSYISRLERKIFSGAKLTWQENVEYNGLEAHQHIIERWLERRRCIALKPILLELLFDQPAIDCIFLGFCMENVESCCPKRIKWRHDK